jgi:hypothetical protein
VLARYDTETISHFDEIVLAHPMSQLVQRGLGLSPHNAHGAYFELPVYKSTTCDRDSRFRGGGSGVLVLGIVWIKSTSRSCPPALNLLGLL